MTNSIDMLGEATLLVSIQKNIASVHKTLFEFLHYQAEELIGEPVGCLFPDVNFDQLLNKSVAYIPYTDTFLVNKYQEEIPVSVSATTLVNDKQDILSICLLIHCFKGRSQNAISLEDIENRYLSMTKNALDAVIVMNSEGQIIEWNPRAEVQFGWTQNEALNAELANLIIPENLRGRHREGLKRFMATGVSKILNMRIELSALHKNGYEFPVELTVTPIKWSNTYLFSAFIRDITLEKSTKMELIQAKEAAESATNAKSEFLAIMSHEIRTPLNGIIGISHLLKETPLTAEQQEYVEYIINSEHTLLTLVNDILDFSKIESGKIVLEESSFDLRSVISESMKVMEPLAKDKSLSLNFCLPTDFPQRMIGDPNKLRQILLNLIGNAIKFTKTGGVNVSIEETKGVSPAQQLTFFIKDTGIGIPEHQILHLFDPFTQADSSTTRKFGGTGLGLAIAKKLVELMGGTIWVESTSTSNPITGTTFCFTTNYKTALKEQNTEQTALMIDNDLVRPQVKILIAEDNQINQKVLLKMLEKEGYHADIASDGNEVLEALKQTTYDIIFMDIHMPEMDGIEVTKRIKEWMPAEKQPFIVAVTANAFVSDKEKYLAAGMDDYISKPILKDQIKCVMAKYLKSL